MSTLLNNIKHETNKTRTDNGDLAVRSTFNHNLDFFGLSGAKRGRNNEVVDMFIKAFTENKLMSLKNILYLRDVRDGNGERDSFRSCLRKLAQLDEDLLIKLLQFVPQVGRWDDILVLIDLNNDKVVNTIIKIVDDQLSEDLMNMEKGQPISLLAKWMPSINTSSKKTKILGKKFSEALYNGNDKKYRKTLSALRKYGDVLEVKLTQKDYTFDYTKLPSKAMMKYTKAFVENDLERYESFKEAIRNDKTLITKKSEVLAPYEIIRKLKSDTDLAISVWDAMPKNTTDKKIMVVRDGSGSMQLGYNNNVTPALVADSLSLYASERLTGPFENTFITFSGSPKLVKLKGQNILEKSLELDTYDEIANTAIEKVYHLLYKSSLKANEEDYLDAVIIISDMEFDAGAIYNKTTYDTIKEKFKEAGIPFPTMVYWNVNSRKMKFPTNDIDNCYFVSGFSKNVFDDITKCEFTEAMTHMTNVLSKYDDIIDKL